MRCPVCDRDDLWENVDEFRYKKAGMHICMNCGFVSYPDKYKSYDEIKNYYKKDYRSVPNEQSFFTGERKLQLHLTFLGDLIDKYNKEEKFVRVFEVGAAHGLFLNMMKNMIERCQVSGTEWTLGYKRTAYHEFGIELFDDFQTDAPHDLVCSYKVLEHQLDPDKELRMYAENLTEDGLIYLSVPVWFDALNNFGQPGFDLEYYYSDNHINVWSLKLLRVLFQKAGLEVVKEDHFLYDSTFLLKRNDDEMKKPRVFEDAEEIKSKMEKIKRASDLFDETEFEAAIAAYENFPVAYDGYYQKNKKRLNEEVGFDGIRDEFFKKALRNCPNSPEIILLCVTICMQYNKEPEAIKMLEEFLIKKPNDVGALFLLSDCYRVLGNRTKDPKKRAKLITNARETVRYIAGISSSERPKAIRWAYFDAANLPTPHEFEDFEKSKGQSSLREVPASVQP